MGGERCEGRDRLAETERTVDVVARLPVFLLDIQTLRWVVAKHSKSLSKIES